MRTDYDDGDDDNDDVHDDGGDDDDVGVDEISFRQ